MRYEMEEKEETRVVGNGVIQGYWLWGGASAAQLGWGLSIFKRGYAGHNNLMPLKAFGVASLFLGAASAALVAGLQLSGIRTVKDLKNVGANIKIGKKTNNHENNA